MVSILEAIFLAIIQGITEWLPISSSGHLVIFQEFFGIKANLAYDVLLHLGTLIVVLIVFRKDILNIIKDIFNKDFKSENSKLLFYIIIASIPVALVGYFLNDIIEKTFQSLTAVSFGLLVTGFILLLSKKTDIKDLNTKNSFIIGLAQALAILPGISRSGSTISTGLKLGIRRDKITKFSFLLIIPAVLGASIFKFKEIINNNSIIINIIGLTTSVIVGYFSLRLLLKIIKAGRFHLFSYYCFSLGSILLLLAKFI